MKNLTLLLLSFFAVSSTIGAQASAEAMIADWERAKAFTLEYLEAMPADQLDIRPTPEVRSFAELMMHIAEANYGFGAAGTAQEMPQMPEDAGMTEEITKETLATKLTESYDYVIEGIPNLDAARMGEEVQLFGQFDLTRGAALAKAFEHQTHHRGQASVYLRMAGVIPPGMKLF